MWFTRLDISSVMFLEAVGGGGTDKGSGRAGFSLISVPRTTLFSFLFFPPLKATAFL